jgi:hypothetical protein
MRTHKILTNFFVLYIMSIFSFSLMAGQNVNDVKSKGPSKLSLFKTPLRKRLPIYARGIWPDTKEFKESIVGKYLKSEYIKKLETWLPIIINKDFLPEKIDPTKWYGIPKPHEIRNSYILSQFYNKNSDTLLQFQADGVHLGVTVTSEKHFAVDVRNITDGKIIQLMTKLLNYPEEKVSRISIEKYIQEIGDNENKTFVCYGRLRCESFDETKAPKPNGENIRTWWNYIPFWIVDGTVSIHTTTVKWEAYPATLEGIFFEL